MRRDSRLGCAQRLTVRAQVGREAVGTTTPTNSESLDVIYTWHWN